MRIGEFSKKTGLSIETLRYYDKIGLLQPAREGMQRVYQEDDLKTVTAIQFLKAVKLDLQEIKKILLLDALVEAGIEEGKYDLHAMQEMLALLQNKYQDVLEYEKEIKKSKDQLCHFINKLEQFLEDKS